MSMKIIYSGFTELFWLDVADSLLENYEWQPVYWIGRFDVEESARQRFPEIVFHSTTEAVRGISPAQYQDLPLTPLDQPLLDAMAKYELTSLNMMDRMDALGSFTYHARVRHYYRLLRFWNSVLDQLL